MAALAGWAGVEWVVVVVGDSAPGSEDTGALLSVEQSKCVVWFQADGGGGVGGAFAPFFHAVVF